MDLSKEDLIIIRNALQVYLLSLQPSAGYIKEIASWKERVDSVQNKIAKILMQP